MAGVYQAVEGFVQEHRPHGSLSYRAGEPGPEGYSLRLDCLCGRGLAMWIRPEDAEYDLLRSGLSAGPN